MIIRFEYHPESFVLFEYRYHTSRKIRILYNVKTLTFSTFFSMDIHLFSSNSWTINSNDTSIIRTATCVRNYTVLIVTIITIIVMISYVIIMIISIIIISIYLS